MECKSGHQLSGPWNVTYRPFASRKNPRARLSVPTNFDDALLDGIVRYPVTDVYGKLTRDPIGGGRASFMLPPVGMRRLREHLAHAHRLNIRFNYLLNAACMDNPEATRPGYRRIRRFIDDLCEAGIEDSVSFAGLLLASHQ